MNLTAKLTFTSDWRIGTGGGRAASVDAVILRDADDLPFVPGKTLRGVWRDAAEELAAALDAAGRSAWGGRVEALFGDQPALGQTAVRQEGLLTVRPARLPETIRNRLAAAELAPLRRALAHERANNRLDARGTTLDDHLRFGEVARRDLSLEAEISLDDDPLDPDETRRMLALLQAAAVFVDGVGAGRRRGLGACELRLKGSELEEVELATMLDDDAPIGWAAAPSLTDHPQLDAEEGQTVRLDLELRARTPLLVAPRVTGNIHVGADAVPGANLLPIVGRAIDQVLGDGISAAAVRRGELTVGFARPLIEGRAGRPVPRCLARYKVGGGFHVDGGVVNRFADRATDADEPTRQVKALRDGYVGELPDRGRMPGFVHPVLEQRVHNSIDDDHQRPLAPEQGGTGGLFVYAVLPAGTRLGGRVRVTGQLAGALQARQDQLLATCTARAQVGRSKRDDYGDVEISARVANEDACPAATTYNVGDELSVWLLAPLVLAEPDGRSLDEQLVDELRGALIAAGASEDLVLEVVESPVGDGGRANAPLMALQTTRLEGWQARWGLPRPSLLALAAGSCAVLQVAAGAIPPSALITVADRGVGERTAEGFGEVALGDPLIVERLADRRAASSPTDTWAPVVEAGALDDSLRTTIERAAITEAVARAAAAFDNDALHATLPGALPSASQLGRLRDAVTPAAGARRRLAHRLADGDDAHWAKRGWTTAALAELRVLAEQHPQRIFDRLAGGSWRWTGLLLDEGNHDEAAERHADVAMRALIESIVRVARRSERTRA